jgi:hypothetical protein
VERKSAQNKRKSRQTEAKLLITTLSIAVTLGAWQALTRQEANSASGEGAGHLPVQTALEAAPLPTLIPVLPEQPDARLPVGSNSQTSKRLILGGAKPQASRPAPVARTRSSR